MHFSEVAKRLAPVNGWTMRQRGDDVTILTLQPTDKVTYYKFLLMSDCHVDHPHHVKEVFDGLHRQAVADGSGILHNGDYLCAMQGRNDRRHNKGSVLPELQSNKYWNKLASYGYNRLKPYKENVMWMGYGNHETAPIKCSEVDPLEMVCEKMNMSGGNVALGAYRSWVVIQAARKQQGGGGKHIHASYKVRAFHGAGGGGPVTKGMIQHQRMMAQTRDADLVWTGHIHEYHDSMWVRDDLDGQFNARHSHTYAVTTPGCKDEATGGVGWAVERGLPPKPLGGAWLILKWDPANNKLTHHALYHARID